MNILRPKRKRADGSKLLERERSPWCCWTHLSAHNVFVDRAEPRPRSAKRTETQNTSAQLTILYHLAAALCSLLSSTFFRIRMPLQQPLPMCGNSDCPKVPTIPASSLPGWAAAAPHIPVCLPVFTCSNTSGKAAHWCPSPADPRVSDHFQPFAHQRPKH